jgi:hypothetical protein
MHINPISYAHAPINKLQQIVNKSAFFYKKHGECVLTACNIFVRNDMFGSLSKNNKIRFF